MAAARTPDPRLQRYVDAVLRQPHNLLSHRDRELLWERHLPECQALAARLPRGPARVLDLGSGAGLPGIIIAIERPDLTVELLEATGKKARFLQEVSDELGLALQVHHGRAEELGKHELRGRFNLVTARAVAPLERLVGWAAPFLAPEGQLWAVKGDRWAEELEAATKQLRRQGLVILHTPEQQTDGGSPRVVILTQPSDGTAAPTPQRL